MATNDTEESHELRVYVMFSDVIDAGAPATPKYKYGKFNDGLNT